MAFAAPNAESESSADLEATKWREFACFDLSAGLGFEKRCFSAGKLELAQRQNSDPEVHQYALKLLVERCILPAQSNWNTLGKTSAWKKTS
jgi:hypothetical protein